MSFAASAQLPAPGLGEAGRLALWREDRESRRRGATLSGSGSFRGAGFRLLGSHRLGRFRRPPVLTLGRLRPALGAASCPEPPSNHGNELRLRQAGD